MNIITKSSFVKKIYNESLQIYTNIIHLSLLHKLFLVSLILIFVYLVNNKSIYLEQYEDMTTGKRFESKMDDAIYDLFYLKYYDKIYENKERDVAQLKIIVSYAKNKKFVKFLDIGCGTGYHVNMLNKMEYDVIGIDKSKAMIDTAKSKYSECTFYVRDIQKNNLFDYNSFTHLLCLNKTIYCIKDKSTFFDNCSLLLSADGLLIIHLIDRDKFKPFIAPKNDKDILYNPENHSNVITSSFIKIHSNLEYVCNYEVVEKNEEITHIDDFNVPYSLYKETFKNTETNNIRRNIINLYIPTIDEILNIAKSKGFTIKDKKSLEFINHEHEYLFILKKTL